MPVQSVRLLALTVLFLAGWLLSPARESKGGNLKAVRYAAAQTQLPVFPGARGFAAFTPAGSGRHTPSPRSALFIVSNLNSAGPGSLREALEARTPRTVVFAISGVIDMRGPVKIRNPYLTVAGQTAGGQGITVVTERFEVATHDVLLQDFAIFIGDRPGLTKPSERDGIVLNGERSPVYNVMIYRLLIEGAIDENFSTYKKVRNVTIDSSIIANSLNRSMHSKGEHGKGILIGDGTQSISIVGSLLSCNHDRNPRVKQGASIEFINNVVYGWGGRTGWNVFNISGERKKDRPVLASIIGNLYIPGPHGRSDIPILYPKGLIKGSRVFMRDNLMLASTRMLEGNRAERPPFSISWDSEPFGGSGIFPLPVDQLWDHVSKNVGPSPSRRAKRVKDIIDEVQSRKGRLKNKVGKKRSGALPFPDYRSRGSDLRLPPHPNAVNPATGYTELETYLHSFG
ncbi:MAG: hypothetical protein J5J00_04315 [Deltaproteobacteria bacterium]|nr:hypothetical protein [Deltaproteobacteria bacterium]